MYNSFLSGELTVWRPPPKSVRLLSRSSIDWSLAIQQTEFLSVSLMPELARPSVKTIWHLFTHDLPLPIGVLEAILWTILVPYGYLRSLTTSSVSTGAFLSQQIWRGRHGSPTRMERCIWSLSKGIRNIRIAKLSFWASAYRGNRPYLLHLRNQLSRFLQNSVVHQSQCAFQLAWCIIPLVNVSAFSYQKFLLCNCPITYNMTHRHNHWFLLSQHLLWPISKNPPQNP